MGPDRQVPGPDRTGQPRVGPAGPFDHLVKGEGKRQSEFGMEMQSNEVSGRNADSHEAGSTRPLLPSTPAQGYIEERLCQMSLRLRLGQTAVTVIGLAIYN